jgi:hypothetical protein
MESIMSKGVPIEPQPEPPKKPDSYFYVSFEGVGSVVITGIDYGHLTPFQMLALAGYLELLGKDELMQQKRQYEEQGSIARVDPEQIDLGNLS